MKTVLLGVCGSEFAKSTIDLILKLKDNGFVVKAILTFAAEKFVYIGDIMTRASVHPYTSSNVSNGVYKLGMPSKYYLDLVEKTDYLLIAPCTANTLAKIANGIADNVLTTVIRCWDFQKPMFIAPAMNPLMWNNSFTKEHVNKIISLGEIEIIMPSLYQFENCTGVGALAPINTIIACLNSARTLDEELKEKEIK